MNREKLAALITQIIKNLCLTNCTLQASDLLER